MSTSVQRAKPKGRPTQRDVSNTGTYSTAEAGERIGNVSYKWVTRRINRERQKLILPSGGQEFEIDVIPYGRTFRIPKRALDDFLARTP
jgi:hypothetical protein